MASVKKDTYGSCESTQWRSSFCLDALETPKTLQKMGNAEELASSISKNKNSYWITLINTSKKFTESTAYPNLNGQNLIY